MRRRIPLLLGMFVGLYAIVEFFVPWQGVDAVMQEFLAWGQILAAFAFVLGGINVIQVNWPKIRRREADWQLKVVLLIGATGMGLVGIKWHSFGGEKNGSIEAMQQQRPTQDAYVRIEATRPETLVRIDGGPAQPAWNLVGKKGQPVEFTIPANQDVAIHVLTGKSGYGEYRKVIRLGQGQGAVIRTQLGMLWGPSGRVFSWLYDHVFDPCNSTMFALLAFFIASAAFRAFRAHNVEAALLLGAAILVMLGRVPIGSALSGYLPLISDWIVDVPNNAGRRAIMMGAALGGIVTGLRIILGLERSHLGAE